MMKKRAVTLVASALALLGSVSTAGATETDFRIFDGAEVGSSQPASRLAAKQVAESCEFEVFSRRGPDPAAVAACEKAVDSLVKRGPDASGAILAVLDEANIGYHGRQRLYDALAKSGDLDTVDALVAGMARIATRDIEEREYEADLIEDALVRLTHAESGEPLPWQSAEVAGFHEQVIERVVRWRSWQRDNEGAAHDELVVQREAEARKAIESQDIDRAYRGARHLLSFDPLAGIVAAKRLQARADLPQQGKDDLNWQIEQAQWRLREEAQRLEQKGPEQKAAPKVPAVAPAAPPAAPPEQKQAPLKLPALS